MNLACTARLTLSTLLVTVLGTADAVAQRERGRRSGAPVQLTHLVYKTAKMKSAVLKRQVEYGVFLPRDYEAEENAQTRYPTIFFLHGMWEDHQRFYSRGGAPVLNRLTGDGSLPKAVFICVNDFSRGSFYINGKRLKIEDMILKELVPHVAATWRCKKGRAHRALLGVSMGGFGALKIAFKHPQVFGVVASHSAAILPEDPDKLLEVFPWAARYSDRMIKPVFGQPVDQDLWAAENPLTLARGLDKAALDGLEVYFDCGDQDRYGFHGPNVELHEVLKAREIAHTWRLVAGGNHGWNSRQTPRGYNQTALPHSLRFIAAAWRQQEANPGGASSRQRRPPTAALSRREAERSGEGRSAPGEDPFPAATPASQGIPDAALARLADLVAGFVKAEEIVGAELRVIKNRRTVLHEVFGHDDRGRGQPLVKDTIFSIRSMTKPLAGAAAQMLIDDGAVKLADPVAKHLASFDTDSSRAVTLEHLLTHRSGFPMKSAGTLWSNYSSYSSVRQVADYWGEYGPRLFTPGEDYRYADANVDTLGAVLEQVAGMPAEALIKRRLLEPLGMRDTIALLRDGDPRVERVACKHAGGRGRWKPFWRWSGKPYFPFPMFAQSFYSTTADYARFLAMVMDGGVVDKTRLLSKAAIARMLTPASKTPMPTGFAALGSSYGQLMHLYDEDGEVLAFGHSGSDGTYAWAWPARDLMVLYFTQSRGSATMMRMEAVIDSLLARRVAKGG